MINFAQAQLGKPYLWGGTGPDAFDCSGLVMMAYRAAGINIPRTSEDQWAQLPHVPVGNVEPGDLVFFAGADGTPTSPGHVGLVIGHDKMIEAYATGFPIRISTFGSPTSAAGPFAGRRLRPALGPARPEPRQFGPRIARIRACLSRAAGLRRCCDSWLRSLRPSWVRSCCLIRMKRGRAPRF